MLQRVIRSLVVAVMTLAVPIQGIGAVTNGQCMSLEHHQAMAAASAAHGAGHASASHEAASHSHDGPGVSKDNTDSNGGHCGPCSACCASASIAGPLLVLDVPAPAGAAYSFSPYPPLGVQPGELDRPPLAL